MGPRYAYGRGAGRGTHTYAKGQRPNMPHAMRYATRGGRPKRRALSGIKGFVRVAREAGKGETEGGGNDK